MPEYQQPTDKILTDDNARGLQTRALLVVKGNEIVAESYGAGITPETQLLGWSMGKA